MHSGFLKKSIWLIVVLVSGTLAGCAEPIPQSTPIPTPIPVIIYIRPELTPLIQAVDVCQAEFPDLVLFISSQAQQADQADLTVGYGSEISGSNKYQVGWDQLLPVYTDPGQDISLNSDDFINRYLAADLGESFADLNLTAWTYPEINILRQVFESVLLETQSSDLDSYIAPDPESMAQALLSADGPAIGYLPAAWKPNNIQEIILSPAIKSRLRLPILIHLANPDWVIGQRVVACLQSGAGQDTLSKNYLPLSP